MKKAKVEEDEAIEEIETEISPWRLGIALILVIIVGSAFVWGVSQLLDRTLERGRQVLGAQQAEKPSNVSIPSQKEVEEYLNNWQEHIKPEDLQKFVASDSAVGEWVTKLEDFQASDKGLIEKICAVMCK